MDLINEKIDELINKNNNVIFTKDENDNINITYNNFVYELKQINKNYKFSINSFSRNNDYEMTINILYELDEYKRNIVFKFKDLDDLTYGVFIQ